MMIARLYSRNRPCQSQRRAALLRHIPGFLSIEFVIALALFALVAGHLASGYWLSMQQQSHALQRLKALSVINASIERLHREPGPLQALADAYHPSGWQQDGIQITLRIIPMPTVMPADALVIPHMIRTHFRLTAVTASWVAAEGKLESMTMIMGAVV